MKKSLALLRPRMLKLLIPAAGLAGLLLRLLLNATGTDDKGLLRPWHPCWLLLLALTAAAALAIIAGTRPIRGSTAYRACFPGSVYPAAGCVLAAVSAAVNAFAFWGSSAGPFVNPIAAAGHYCTGAALTLAPLALVAVALCRLKERKPNFLLHVVICLSFALQTLTLYQTWSFDPQIQHYCFQLLASIALTMTAYQLACFDTGKGSHRKLWLWGLAAVYLCCVSMANGLFFITGAAWAWTSLSALRRPRKPAAQETEVKAEE